MKFDLGHHCSVDLFSFFFLPSLGKVGPVGDQVAGDVPVTGPVRQWSGEWFPEHILQVVRVVRSYPAGVGQHQTPHAVGLGEQVGVCTATSANSLGGTKKPRRKQMVTMATDEETLRRVELNCTV